MICRLPLTAFLAWVTIATCAADGKALVRDSARRFATYRSVEGTATTTVTVAVSGKSSRRITTVAFALMAPNMGYARTKGDDPVLDQVTFVCDSRQTYLYSPVTNRFVVGTAPPNLMRTAMVLPGSIGSFADSVAQSKASYALAGSAALNGTPVYIVKTAFRPTNPESGSARDLRQVTLTVYLRKADLMPIVAEQRIGLRDGVMTIRTELTGVRVNKPVDPRLFRWNPPPSAREMRNGATTR